MQDLPHHYLVSSRARPSGDVDIAAAGLPSIAGAAPAEFGGPGDRWSPESLLVASVASCLVLSFKAVARASKLDWNGLDCEVTGTLERVDRVMRFTSFDIEATVTVGAEVSEDRARRVLEKAKSTCLITNSLAAQTTLNATIERG